MAASPEEVAGIMHCWGNKLMVSVILVEAVAVT
jgi:hypothetical protein